MLLSGCVELEDSASDVGDDVDFVSDADALTTWVECAREMGTPGTQPSEGVCNFTGTRAVRYGTASQYVTRSLTGPVTCANTVFGDPAYGTWKRCWYAEESPDSDWTFCANENGTCSFSGNAQVLYGASTSSQYTIVDRSNGTPCNNATFGDPAYGVWKKCWFKSTGGGGGGGGFAKTQMFRLGNPDVTVEAGQNAVFTIRVWAKEPLSGPSKIAAHLLLGNEIDPPAWGGSGDSNPRGVYHHYEWLPSGAYPGYGIPYNTQWSDYLEFDYNVHVPETTPTGDYRIAAWLAQGVSPWEPYVWSNGVECNGVPTVTGANNLHRCEVGTLHVTARVNPPSKVGTMAQSQSVFAVSGRTWSP